MNASNVQRSTPNAVRCPDCRARVDIDAVKPVPCFASFGECPQCGVGSAFVEWLAQQQIETSPPPLTGRMHRVCSYCGDRYGFLPCLPRQDGQESHGVCHARECRQRFADDMGVSVADLPTVEDSSRAGQKKIVGDDQGISEGRSDKA